MALYTPPSSDLPIFDSDVFITNDSNLTIDVADKRYLKYPLGQGTENLTGLNVNGPSNLSGTNTFSGTNNISGTNAINGTSSFTGSIQIQQLYLTGSGNDNTVNGNTIFNKTSTPLASSVINNCFIGKDAGPLLTVGNNNCCVGHNNCAHILTSGSNNTSIGGNVLTSVTNTNNNTALGYSSGINANGSNNTFIGALANISTVQSYSNSTCLGYNSKITGNRQVVLGTSLETVIIPNQINYTYTVLPTFSAGSIGYTISGSYSYIVGTGEVSTISLPVGVFMISFNVQYSGVIPANYYTTTPKTTGNWGFSQIASAATFNSSSSYIESLSAANASYYLKVLPAGTAPVSTNFYFTATRIA